MQMTVARVLAGVVGWFAAGAGCGSVAATPPDAAGTSDAPTAAASPDATLSWSALSPVAVDYAGPVIAPVVSEDGLTLYFLAELTSPAFDYDIYSASRASLDGAFGVATQLISRRSDRTAAFTTTEVLQVIGISAVRFAATHWSNRESAIWASTGVNSNVETLQVSLLR